MDEDTLDAASSAARSDNEIAMIEEQSGSSEIILPSSEKTKRRIQRQQRQITRLKESLSYRIGRHITIAVEKPWRIPFLPITFPVYVFLLGLEKLGRRARKKIETEYDSLNLENQKNISKDAIVFFPTNGVGFGHFTRLYAIARRLRKSNPDAEIIFFTTMPTLHIPYSEGFVTYNLAGRGKQKEMSASKWNMLLEEMLTLVFETHKPRAFVFDGAFPYRGMLNAIRENNSTKKIWVRRGMFKKGSKIPVDSIEHFDLIIHPGDAVEEKITELNHNAEIMETSAITLFHQNEMWAREKARRRIGIPSDCIGVYVQLGAGRINDIESEVRMVIDSLLDNEKVQVVLGESMLGNRIDIEMERVHIIRDYPNSMYLDAFDYSVQAGGYNSFHEMRLMRLPTLFLPNMNTGMDDQLSRCLEAEKEGWGIVNQDRAKSEINKDVNKMFELSNQEVEGNIPNGADEISQRLSQMLLM